MDVLERAAELLHQRRPGSGTQIVPGLVAQLARGIEDHDEVQTIARCAGAGEVMIGE